ncbi:DTX [Mytilus coruscus]|uniref:E3 ubiquitin-protein ligase n=1 Tax=Mytilus coruscus TaxID=42192 RepID=A0A6J8CEE8_MYTCO|nr:DTX [Mytilus coruscus]
MSFGEGIDALIYKPTGKQYTVECENNIGRYGTLQVGTCVSSSSNNLYYKYVIHTAEPRWHDYNENEKQKCALDLKQCISAVPIDMCAKEYCKAIEEYSRIRKNTSSIIEIHFIDKNYALVSLIKQEFAQAFNKPGQYYVGKPDAEKYNLKPFSKSTNVRAAQLCVRTGIDSGNAELETTCPQCGGIQGILIGIQPPGRMETNIKSSSLCGFPGTNTIEIVHPNPGRPFEGITRQAYLPNNTKSQLVAKLLQIAFDRRLIFTIGTSRTTGKTGVITWNDINHKTNPEHNATFGLPDDTYFDRVLDDLGFKDFFSVKSSVYGKADNSSNDLEDVFPVKTSVYGVKDESSNDLKDVFPVKSSVYGKIDKYSNNLEDFFPIKSSVHGKADTSFNNLEVVFPIKSSVYGKADKSSNDLEDVFPVKSSVYGKADKSSNDLEDVFSVSPLCMAKQINHEMILEDVFLVKSSVYGKADKSSNDLEDFFSVKSFVYGKGDKSSKALEDVLPITSSVYGKADKSLNDLEDFFSVKSSVYGKEDKSTNDLKDVFPVKSSVYGKADKSSNDLEDFLHVMSSVDGIGDELSKDLEDFFLSSFS